MPLPAPVWGGHRALADVSSRRLGENNPLYSCRGQNPPSSDGEPEILPFPATPAPCAINFNCLRLIKTVSMDNLKAIVVSNGSCSASFTNACLNPLLRRWHSARLCGGRVRGPHSSRKKPPLKSLPTSNCDTHYTGDTPVGTGPRKTYNAVLVLGRLLSWRGVNGWA